MNSLLFTIAVAIVGLLFAALIAPFFINWNDYRSTLERHIEQVIGVDVQLAGAIDGRILPIPHFTMRDVRVLGPEGDPERPVLVVPDMEATLALAPLLKGLINVTEVELRRPVLRLAMRDDGAMVWGAMAGEPAISAQAILIDTLRVTDGAMVLVDGRGAETFRIGGIGMVGTAGSLAGPFRVEGGALHEERRYGFRLGTGRLQEDGRLRAKLVLSPVDGAFDITADGLIGQQDGRPHFEGRLGIGHAPLPERDGPEGQAERGALPWRLGGDLEMSTDGGRLANARLELGPQARAVTLGGGVQVDFRPALRLTATAAARQIDLDRAFAAPGTVPGEGEDGKTRDGRSGIRAGRGEMGLGAMGPALIDALGTLRALPDGSRLTLTADAAVLNGGLAEGFAVEALVERESLKIERLDTRLPGSSSLSAKGAVTLKPDGAPELELAMRLSSRHLGALSEWARLGAVMPGGLEARRGAMVLEASARVSAGRERLALRDIDARLDDSHLTGHVRYDGAGAGSLDVAVTADRIDLDRYVQAPAEGEGLSGGVSGGLFGRLPGLMRLKLDVGAASVAGFQAGGIGADMVLSDGVLDIRALEMRDVAGLSLSASGRVDDVLGDAQGALEARLASDDLSGIAALIADLGWVGMERTALLRQARRASPADLRFSLTAGRGTGRESGQQAAITLDGQVAGSRLEAQARLAGRLADWQGSHVEARATLANPDSARLLAQIGLIDGPSGAGAEPAGAALPGEMRATFSGVPGGEAGGALSARLMGAELDADGRWRGALHDIAATVSVDSADARPLLALLALPVRDAQADAALPLSLRARVEAEGGGLALNGIEGHAGGNTFSGALTLAQSGDANAPSLSGAMALDMLALDWLGAALLGKASMAWPDADEAWPQGPFDTARMRGLDGRVQVAAGRLALGRGLAAHDARFTLGARGGAITIEAFTGRALGGTLLGEARLAARPSGVALSADMAIAEGRLEDVVWAPGGTPAAAGGFGLKARFSGEGRSWLGLVSSLAGGGTLTLADADFRRLDAGAFAGTLRAADAGLELDEARVREAFGGFLDAGGFPVARAAVGFTIGAGVIAARNVELPGASGGVHASAMVDLHSMMLDSEWALTADAASMEVPEGERASPLPPVTIVFAGDIAAPERQLDVSALAGHLTVRRLEQDLSKLEEAQAAALEEERRREREAAERAKARAERQAKEEAERKAREEAERKAREEAERKAKEAAEVAEDADAPGGPDGHDGGDGPEQLDRLIERALEDMPQPPGAPPASQPPASEPPAPQPEPSPPGEARSQTSPPGVQPGAALPALPPPVELQPPPGAGAGTGQAPPFRDPALPVH